MRFAVGAGLVLLVGCNRIFGITETRLWDAPVDVIEDMPHVALTWQVAAFTSAGAPAPLEYLAIDPAMAPVIRIAPLDKPFQPAEYRTSADQPGWIPIPREFEHTTWRLEYALPDPDPVRGAPHEVQWAPDEKQGYLTVPVVGRATTESVPVSSGYQLTVPASLMMPGVFTTGLWSVSKQVAVTATQAGSIVDYDFSNAIWLGRRGRLVGSQGDRALLVDFAADSGCRVATGGGEVPPGSVDLKPGEHASATVSDWDMTRQSVSITGISFDFPQRLLMALGMRHGTFQLAQSFRLHGVVPSLSFPGLMGASPNQILPVPVMLTLLQCQYDKPAALPATAHPTSLSKFPTVMHVQLVDSRSLTLIRDGGGTTSVTLSSGIETVLEAKPDMTGGTTSQLAFPAAIATKIKLTTPASVLDLADGVDQQVAGPPSGLFLLDFVPEPGVDLRADYHDVILHRITDAALVPVRVYTVTQPHVQIDAAALAGNADYVFEIRTYKGHPQAPHGDFRPVDYPYGAAIVFTRTFRTASR